MEKGCRYTHRQALAVMEAVQARTAHLVQVVEVAMDAHATVPQEVEEEEGEEEGEGAQVGRLPAIVDPLVEAVVMEAAEVGHLAHQAEEAVAVEVEEVVAVTITLAG